MACPRAGRFTVAHTHVHTGLTLLASGTPGARPGHVGEEPLTLMTSSSADSHSTDSETSVTAPFASTDTTLTGRVTVSPVRMAVFRSSAACGEAGGQGHRAASRGAEMTRPPGGGAWAAGPPPGTVSQPG